MRISQDTTAALEVQLRRFEEKIGRPPEPDEPISFDPDADSPLALSLVDVGRAFHSGRTWVCPPAWIYAYPQTDGLLPHPDGTFRTEQDATEWQEAINRYIRVHGSEQADRSNDMRITAPSW